MLSPSLSFVRHEVRPPSDVEMHVFSKRDAGAVLVMIQSVKPICKACTRGKDRLASRPRAPLEEGEDLKV